MLQFHGSIAEIASEIKRVKEMPKNNEAYLNYLYALFNFRYERATGGNDLAHLGEVATRACVEFNKTLAI